MMLTVAELTALRHYIDVATQMLARELPGCASLAAEATVRAWLTSEISRQRNTGEHDPEESSIPELLSTRQAAKAMGRSQRRIQQKIKAGQLRAEKIGRESFLRREDIA